MIKIKDLYQKNDYNSILIYCESKISRLSEEELYYLSLTLFELGYFCEYLEMFTYLGQNVIFDVSRGYAYSGLTQYSFGAYKTSRNLLLDSINFDGEFSSKALEWYKLLCYDIEEFYCFENQNIIYHFVDFFLEEEIDDFISKYENAFERINKLLYINKLPKKVDVYIYKKRKDQLGNNLSYANPFLLSIHVYHQEEAGHELAHVLVNYITSKIQNKSKLIQEGIAEYFNNMIYNDIVYKFKCKIDIEKMWNDYLEMDSLQYAIISEQLVVLLLEYQGWGTLIKLLKNQSLENAISLYGDYFYIAKEEIERCVSEGTLMVLKDY